MHDAYRLHKTQSSSPGPAPARLSREMSLPHKIQTSTSSQHRTLANTIDLSPNRHNGSVAVGGAVSPNRSGSPIRYRRGSGSASPVGDEGNGMIRSFYDCVSNALSFPLSCHLSASHSQ